MRPGRVGINAGKKMLENARCNAEEGKKHEAYAKSCNGYYAGEGAQPKKMLKTTSNKFLKHGSVESNGKESIMEQRRMSELGEWD
ncbi:hypothetical protein BCON_0175g00030 [Botryotinia convoluta]|uniref:Uncharacterized protein n=1 Tax=Botryotinia convoluta TaxID=54673 RepID=A0A4Z1I298_9HELO|nr:hypothetical protein BCON_0175g00030 [Botryotinia convoluta]